MIVVAAGAWIAPLLDGVVGLPPLRVTQQQVFHFAPVSGQEGAGPADPWPVFIHDDGTDYTYGLPGGRDGEVPGAIKVGEHAGFRTTTAADRDFIVDPAARARVMEFVGKRIPGLSATPVNEVTCLTRGPRTRTSSSTVSGPFVVASPCSGHGAKFAPLLGEIIADLAASPRQKPASRSPPTPPLAADRHASLIRSRDRWRCRSIRATSG